MSNDDRNISKHTDFTLDEIKTYLSKLRKCIIDDKYTVEQNRNRRENIDFINDYKITTKKEAT